MPRLRCRGRAFPGAMVRTELRQPVHRCAVFLVCPGELEPEIALGHGRRPIAARDEDPQRGVAVSPELTDFRLQRAELFPGAAR